MTDQPKPTPCPFCGEQPELHKHNDQGGKVYLMFGCFSNACPTEACYIDGGYLVSPSAEELTHATQCLVDKWAAALIARAPELQQRVDELEFVYKMSDATNDALRKDNASLLDDNVRIAQERDEATEALEQYALRTNQQIDGITQKLDTFTAENQRLRELLLEAVDWVPNPVDLYDRINNAIGRTGE